MATKKISELIETTSPKSTDVFPIVNGGETKKVQLTNIKNTLGITAIDTRLTTVEGEIDTAQSDIDNLQTGWNVAGETWTYSSVDDPTGVITISGDVTTKYSLGMKIKFTNNSNIIYGIITAISYTSPNTTLTFLHEINPSNSQALHIMTNSAISNSYYSMLKAPSMFPLNPRKWTITYTDSTNRLKDSPTLQTWYNATSFSIPIGLWEMDFSIAAYVERETAGIVNLKITISSANNSESDATKTLNMQGGPLLTLGDQSFFARFVYETSSKITRYINYCTTESGMSRIAITNNRKNMVISLKCAYL